MMYEACFYIIFDDQGNPLFILAPCPIFPVSGRGYFNMIYLLFVDEVTPTDIVAIDNILPTTSRAEQNFL